MVILPQDCIPSRMHTTRPDSCPRVHLPGPGLIINWTITCLDRISDSLPGPQGSYVAPIPHGIINRNTTTPPTHPQTHPTPGQARCCSIRGSPALNNKASISKSTSQLVSGRGTCSRCCLANMYPDSAPVTCPKPDSVHQYACACVCVCYKPGSLVLTLWAGPSTKTMRMHEK